MLDKSHQVNQSFVCLVKLSGKQATKQEYLNEEELLCFFTGSGCSVAGSVFTLK